MPMNASNLFLAVARLATPTEWGSRPGAPQQIVASPSRSIPIQPDHARSDEAVLSSLPDRNGLANGLLLHLLLPQCGGTGKFNAMDSPNLLFVFADQWTYWALGCNGNPEVRTPRIDQFAAESVNCINAISSCPVCTPARASLLTGLRPDRHGLFINDAPLDPSLPSFGKHFAAAGYDTAYVGKWHVNGHGRSVYIPPERRHGFRYFKALECTHNYPKSRYFDNDDATPRFWEGYDAFAQTDDLIGWMQNREDDHQPFCAVLSWGPPHNPYETAPEAYRLGYDPAALTPRDNVPEADQPRCREILAGYYAHCEALDTAFGRLLDAIDAMGCRDNTVVVFTSDHGDMLKSHGMIEKQCPFEESLRIPYLIRAPWVLPAGTVNRTVIEFADSWPTLAGLCGLPDHEPIQTKDQSAHLIAGTVPDENAGLYASYVPFATWIQQQNIPELFRAREARGLRTERHLYVESLEGPWLLYDCQEDPYQMQNLVDAPAFTSLREELATRLKARLADEKDNFLPCKNYITQWGYQVDEMNAIPTGNWTDRSALSAPKS